MDWGFLARTARMTVVAALCFGLTGGVYLGPAWGGFYLFFALWALGLFSLTALILRSLDHKWRALGLTALKLPCLGLAFVAFKVAMDLPPAGRIDRVLGIAIFAGVVTPLLVFVLRALGVVSETLRATHAPGSDSRGSDSTSEGLELRS